MNVIEDLLVKRNDLFKQLEAIDTVLKMYGHKADDYIFDNPNSNSTETNSKVFPTKARKEKQILWVFENALHNGIKLTDFQKLFNENMGNDSVKIDNTARRLKREGKLILVKYNDKNIYSFWGLPSWVEGNDFKPEYKPSEEQLPEIKLSEVVRE